jgi:steroid 5-alpha reductase family enzyme
LNEILSSSTYSSVTTFIDVYAGIGPVLPGLIISMLFLGSTTFTEWISARKYPTYKVYQRRVGMFSPIGTIASGWYLSMIGERENVDQQIWGTGKIKNGVKAE